MKTNNKKTNNKKTNNNKKPNKVVFIGLKEASKDTGLSETSLRRGVRDGRLPFIRSGGGTTGKILFDKFALLQALRNEAIGNVTDEKPRSYLASLFQDPEKDDTGSTITF